eukprot:1161538-Alexandrium_andersonii.AAC.1
MWNDKVCLQLVATYAPGDSAQRTRIWQGLAESGIILPETDSLCIVAGDFNFVEYDEGRCNLQEQEGT